jgi:hypothetical protein
MAARLRAPPGLSASATLPTDPRRRAPSGHADRSVEDPRSGENRARRRTAPRPGHGQIASTPRARCGMGTRIADRPASEPSHAAARAMQCGNNRCERVARNNTCRAQQPSRVRRELRAGPERRASVAADHLPSSNLAATNRRSPGAPGRPATRDMAWQQPQRVGCREQHPPQRREAPRVRRELRAGPEPASLGRRRPLAQFQPCSHESPVAPAPRAGPRRAIWRGSNRSEWVCRKQHPPRQREAPRVR